MDTEKGIARIGIVAKNASGDLTTGCGREFHGSSVDITESPALRKAVLLAKGKKLKEVILETDSEVVFKTRNLSLTDKFGIQLKTSKTRDLPHLSRNQLVQKIRQSSC